MRKVPFWDNDIKRKTGLKGFEPLTCGLRVRRYAELSYRPTLLGLIMWSMMPNKGFGMLRVIRLEAGEECVSVLRHDRESSDPKQEKNA